MAHIESAGNRSHRRKRRRLLYACVASCLALLAVAALWIYRGYPLFAPQYDEKYELVETTPQRTDFGFAIARKTQPARGRLHALLLFAQFKGEGDERIPDYAAQLFDAYLPGSFAHFYRTMSFDQLLVEGAAGEKRFSSRRTSTAYLARSVGEEGRFGEFALEILQQADREVDFAQFDNDGPDGIPASGDDDGLVDYLFLAVRSTPRHFILGGATGIVSLGFDPEYVTADTAADGRPIRVSGALPYGALFREGSFAYTVGTMAHEFGHSLGLPDLYDLDRPDAAGESAGIGKWGLMGDGGATGWNDRDGPNPLCAKSREFLGWLGPDNERLIEVSQDTTLKIVDIHEGGAVVKVPLRAHVLEGSYYEQEYLLLEMRTRDSHYYNRYMPADGLLVWHIRPHAFLLHGRGQHNGTEEVKLVDLVCADGLFEDAGYPRGRKASPLQGRDNLDFWALDADYRRAHEGNRGDGTDLFDGIEFTDLHADTNPSMLGADYSPAGPFTGLALRHIRPQGRGLAVDVIMPRWSGTIRDEVHWIGDIFVDGDLTVAPEGRLIIHDHTRVRFAGTDRLGSGLDPRRCELQVEGELRMESMSLFVLDNKGRHRKVEKRGIAFTTLEPDATWLGVLLLSTARIDDDLRTEIAIQNAEFGLLTGKPDFAVLPLDGATAVADEETASVADLDLRKIFPNPFNSQTTIEYVLPEAAEVRLTVFNSLGQVTRVLEDGWREAGSQTVVWDGRDETGREVASGLFICQLVVGDRRFTRPMTLAR